MSVEIRPVGQYPGRRLGCLMAFDTAGVWKFHNGPWRPRSAINARPCADAPQACVHACGVRPGRRRALPAAPGRTRPARSAACAPKPGRTARSLKIELLLVLRFASTHLRQGLCPLADSVGNDLLRLLPLSRAVALTTGKARRYRHMTSSCTRRRVASAACPSADSRSICWDRQADTQERNRWILVHKSPPGAGESSSRCGQYHAPLYGLTTPLLAGSCQVSGVRALGSASGHACTSSLFCPPETESGTMRVPGDVKPKEPRCWRLVCTRPTDIPGANEGTLTVNDQILQGCRSCELTLSRAQALAIHPVFPHHERVMAIVVHALGLCHSNITKPCERLGSVLPAPPQREHCCGCVALS